MDISNDFQADLAAAKCKAFDAIERAIDAARTLISGADFDGHLANGAAHSVQGQLDDILSDLRSEMEIDAAIDDLAEWECPRNREPEVMFRQSKPGGTL